MSCFLPRQRRPTSGFWLGVVVGAGSLIALLAIHSMVERFRESLLQLRAYEEVLAGSPSFQELPAQCRAALLKHGPCRDPYQFSWVDRLSSLAEEIWVSTVGLAQGFDVAGSTVLGIIKEYASKFWFPFFSSAPLL